MRAAGKIQTQSIKYCIDTRGYFENKQTEYVGSVLAMSAVYAKIGFAFKCLFAKRMYSIVNFAYKTHRWYQAIRHIQIEFSMRKWKSAFDEQPGLFMSLVCFWLVCNDCCNLLLLTCSPACVCVFCRLLLFSSLFTAKYVNFLLYQVALNRNIALTSSRREKKIVSNKWA